MNDTLELSATVVLMREVSARRTEEMIRMEKI